LIFSHLLAIKNDEPIELRGAFKGAGAAANDPEALHGFFLPEMTFLLQHVPAWSSDLGKRPVKSPKIMLCGTGVGRHVSRPRISLFRCRFFMVLAMV
jgi:hypothetical protein